MDTSTTMSNNTPHNSSVSKTATGVKAKVLGWWSTKYGKIAALVLVCVIIATILYYSGVFENNSESFAHGSSAEWSIRNKSSRNQKRSDSDVVKGNKKWDISAFKKSVAAFNKKAMK